MALAGLETGTIDDEFHGALRRRRDFLRPLLQLLAKSGHGDAQSCTQAIVHSCDVYFYTVGNKLGIDNIAAVRRDGWAWARKPASILPGEAEGLMPSSKWKLRTQREKWYAGETISVAIGQGAVHGDADSAGRTPSAESRSGGVWYQPAPGEDGDASGAGPRVRIWNPENIATVVSGMYGVVNEGRHRRVGARSRASTYRGKTGSAAAGLELNWRNPAKLATRTEGQRLVRGFAPRENPGDRGGGAAGRRRVTATLAAPIVRDVIKAYFDKKARGDAEARSSRLLFMQQPGAIAGHAIVAAQRRYAGQN